MFSNTKQAKKYTCRGHQLGDVSLYSVIKRRLNPFNFNIWPHANSETFILKSRCTINGIFRNRLMFSPMLAKVYK